jgi:hypothetical protein
VVADVIGEEKLNKFVNNESKYQLTKAYPVFVGAGVGRVAIELYATVWLATVLPLLLLKLTIYALIVHFA